MKNFFSKLFKSNVDADAASNMDDALEPNGDSSKVQQQPDEFSQDEITAMENSNAMKAELSKPIKLLSLSTLGSGKSTLFKQAIIIYSKGYNERELKRKTSKF